MDGGAGVFAGGEVGGGGHADDGADFAGGFREARAEVFREVAGGVTLGDHAAFERAHEVEVGAVFLRHLAEEDLGVAGEDTGKDVFLSVADDGRDLLLHGELGGVRAGGLEAGDVRAPIEADEEGVLLRGADEGGGGSAGRGRGDDGL